VTLVSLSDESVVRKRDVLRMYITQAEDDKTGGAYWQLRILFRTDGTRSGGLSVYAHPSRMSRDEAVRMLDMLKRTINCA